MSLSLLGAGSLIFAANFGQAGFPTQQEVEACVMPTMTVVVTLMATEDPAMEPVEDMFMSAYAKYLAWDLYYDGRRFDDEDFKEVSGDMTETNAAEAFTIAQALNDENGSEMEGYIQSAFACMEAAKPHGLIYNRDGTGGGV